MVRIVENSGCRYTRVEILRAFPPVERKKPQQREFQPNDCDEERIVDALKTIPADDYQIWLEIGMGIKAELGGRGRSIWDAWSSHSEKFNAKDQEKTWRAFKRDGIGIGTLFYYAKQNGWTPPRDESKREIWRAAGYCLRRWMARDALRTFLKWCDRHGVSRRVGLLIFETNVDKELAR